MKKLVITALTAFAFLTTPVFGGDRSFDMDNAFPYTKSTISEGTGSSAGANAAIVGIGMILLVLVAVAASTSD